jgi:hypothetical protein
MPAVNFGDVEGVHPHQPGLLFYLGVDGVLTSLLFF